MPARDGTGPMGQGPLTGRGFGPCGAGRGYGMGFGRGFGRGWGFRPAYQPYPARYVPVNYAPENTREQEITALKDEKDMMEQELKGITERIRELERNK
jgi:hypothetical protein